MDNGFVETSYEEALSQIDVPQTQEFQPQNLYEGLFNRRVSIAPEDSHSLEPYQQDSLASQLFGLPVAEYSPPPDAIVDISPHEEINTFIPDTFINNTFTHSEIPDEITITPSIDPALELVQTHSQDSLASQLFGGLPVTEESPHPDAIIDISPHQEVSIAIQDYSAEIAHTQLDIHSNITVTTPDHALELAQIYLQNRDILLLEDRFPEVLVDSEEPRDLESQITKNTFERDATNNTEVNLTNLEIERLKPAILPEPLSEQIEITPEVLNIIPEIEKEIINPVQSSDLIINSKQITHLLPQKNLKDHTLINKAIQNTDVNNLEIIASTPINTIVKVLRKEITTNSTADLQQELNHVHNVIDLLENSEAFESIKSLQKKSVPQMKTNSPTSQNTKTEEEEEIDESSIGFDMQVIIPPFLTETQKNAFEETCVQMEEQISKFLNNEIDFSTAYTESIELINQVCTQYFIPSAAVIFAVTPPGSTTSLVYPILYNSDQTTYSEVEIGEQSITNTSIVTLTVEHFGGPLTTSAKDNIIATSGFNIQDENILSSSVSTDKKPFEINATDKRDNSGSTESEIGSGVGMSAPTSGKVVSSFNAEVTTGTFIDQDYLIEM